jgi:hypothetical protein
VTERVRFEPENIELRGKTFPSAAVHFQLDITAMLRRNIRSIEALTALAFSVIKRAPGLHHLTRVTIVPVKNKADRTAGGPQFTWELHSVTLRNVATSKEFASAEKALDPWRARYDLENLQSMDAM